MTEKHLRNIIAASTSTLFGGEYLDYLMEEIKDLFKDTDDVIFVPYARPGGISHDEYTSMAAKAFKKIGKNIIGLHTFENPVSAIQDAGGIFTGGGNTFVLVRDLYHHGLIEAMREVIFTGTPYLGSSAGSNICGISIGTTNDMPIVYPPSFKTMGVSPFNINPHYLDPIPGNRHMGETRETRIKEFHTQNTIPVVGIREGSWIRGIGNEFVLKGNLKARIFEYQKNPYELEPESIISFD